MFTIMTFVLSIGKQPAIGRQHMPHSFCKASFLTEGDITDTFQDCYRDSKKARQDSFIMCHFQLNPVMRHRGNGPQSRRERNYALTFQVSFNRVIKKNYHLLANQIVEYRSYTIARIDTNYLIAIIFC